MPVRSPSTVSADLIQRLEDVVAALGIDKSRGFVRRWSEYNASNNRQIVRQAFETIGVHSIFGFRSGRGHKATKFSPVLYLTASADDAGAHAVHRLVWSQGVVPILLIATPQGLQIRKSLIPGTPNPLTVPWSKLGPGQPLPVELTSLTAVALSSSVVWRDYAIDRSNRVDTALLKAIESLNDVVRRRNATLK